MRILSAFVGGRGHFEPLVPIARAAQTAGHTVAFACGESMVAEVRTAGFTTLWTEPSDNDDRERLPLVAPDPVQEDKVLREGFARKAGKRRSADIIERAPSWQPDVIMCDETDFGAMIAAEVLGIPHVTVLINASGSFVRYSVVGEALNEVRASYGLPPDSDLGMLGRHLVISPFPPSLRDPAYPLPATGHTIRTQHVSTSDPVEPTVYFTLGTVFNTESGDLFTRVLAGLSRLPAHVIATVGRHIDPADLGPQPSNVRVERFIPQASILPACSLVVSHGGSGSLNGTLAHGLPTVLIPMGADQLVNAQRCAELGFGKVLDPITVTRTMSTTRRLRYWPGPHTARPPAVLGTNWPLSAMCLTPCASLRA